MDYEISVDGEVTRAHVDSAGPDLLILAHGAGTDMKGKTILALKDEFVRRGISVARFNFLYKQQGKSIPDKMPKLMASYRAVAELLRREVKPSSLVCGGHSMGGRTASMLAAEGYPMDGLLLLAYPLHPAGKPEKLRDEHLPSISVPTLCINGTQDELCIRELMDGVLPRLQPTWEMHWLEHADHSYKVPRSSGRTNAEVLTGIGELVASWMDQRRSHI
jgi:uncharacterized protein